MKRLPAVLIGLLFAAACSDREPTRVDLQSPTDLAPSLDLVDAGHGQGGNSKFHFLEPLVSDGPSRTKGFPGYFPTVEVCLRNAAGDGCEANQPLLATFSREGGGIRNRVLGKNKGHYTVLWHMKDFTPVDGGIYRIRVLLYGAELGHADVITIRHPKRSDITLENDGIVPIRSSGAFVFAFLLEEGALEQQFCDFDGDLDVRDCDVGIEDPTDGNPTVLTVVEGAKVAAVITAPNGVFIDAQGNPIPDVIFTAEVEVGPPSKDLILDDSREHPYFIELNTFPNDVFIDPNGPGVTVVVCQDDAVLLSRGIPSPLHPQLILYKVTDPKPGFPNGETKRLPTGVGAPVCNNPPPAAAATGLAGLLRSTASGILGLLTPEPVRARRLHGGLNTLVVRGISSSDAAFSTFGSTLGPNASQSTAIVPDGAIGQPTQILVEVRTALGDLLAFGGDTIALSVSGGPNAGAPITVIDNGNGTYSATYTPSLAGVDTITASLTTAEGWFLGPIVGSPFTSNVGGLAAIGTFANSRGIVAIPVVWDVGGGPLTIATQTSSETCGVFQPSGIDPTRGLCFAELSITGGPYTLTTTLGSSSVSLNATATLPTATVNAVTASGTDVVVSWTAAPSHASFMVFIWNNGLVAPTVVSASTLTNGVGSVTLPGAALVTGRGYSATVIAFEQDLTTTFPLTNRVNGSGSSPYSFVYTPSVPEP